MKTLAETATEDDDDAVNWVEKSRKIQQAKEEAKKRAKMLEEMDEAFGLGNIVETELVKEKAKAYTGRDLKGLKVEHDRVSHHYRRGHLANQVTVLLHCFCFCYSRKTLLKERL